MCWLETRNFVATAEVLGLHEHTVRNGYVAWRQFWGTGCPSAPPSCSSRCACTGCSALPNGVRLLHRNR